MGNTLLYSDGRFAVVLSPDGWSQTIIDMLDENFGVVCKTRGDAIRVANALNVAKDHPTQKPTVLVTVRAGGVGTGSF